MYEGSNEISGEECFYIMEEFSWGLRNCRFWERYFYNASINVIIPLSSRPDRFTLEIRGARILDSKRRWKEWGEIILDCNLHFSKLSSNHIVRIQMGQVNLILKENCLDYNYNAYEKMQFGYNGQIYRSPIHRFHNRCAYVPKLDEFAACVAVTMLRELFPYAKKIAQKKERILNKTGTINYPESRRGWWDRKTCYDFRGKHLPTSSILIDGTEFEINENEIKINTI